MVKLVEKEPNRLDKNYQNVNWEVKRKKITECELRILKEEKRNIIIIIKIYEDGGGRSKQSIK